MTTYDLQIIQGSTYNINLNITDDYGNPIDLTSYTISGYLKFRYSDSGFLANLNPTILSPSTSGIVNINVPANVTSGIPITMGFYDIEIYNGTSVTQILNGNAYISPYVTF